MHALDAIELDVGGGRRAGDERDRVARIELGDRVRDGGDDLIGLDDADVPPRYRSSYFLHIWANGYAAGYYAYLWSENLDDNAFQWFEDHGGLTRANGDRFRQMVLSRGNTEDLATMYAAWLGKQPTIEPMLKYRGLSEK